MSMEDKLAMAMRNRILHDRHRMAVYIERLKGLSPLDKLNQGYSYAEDGNGRTLNDIHKVSLGDLIQVYVKNGKIQASVTGKWPVEREEI